MQEIIVELGARSYPIYIGKNLLGIKNLISSKIPCKQVLVVTNATIAPLYLEKVLNSLKKNHDIEVIILPDGEQYKTLDTVYEVITKLLDKRFSRNSCLLALGGGVIGDITGFSAACYQRGIKFIQLPTTVLAQVDSSVGGKTGVNHPAGKNMIGAFHQPIAVIIDTDFLDTLDKREICAGLAEVFKYGLIRDANFFIWLESNIDKLLMLESETLTYAIEQSCKNKAKIIEQDEQESGMRAILNFGHTFGHAIETGLGYGKWLHGEAVALGMLMAADLSCQLGWISELLVTRIKNILVKLDLPVLLPSDFDPIYCRELMMVDKKTKDGVLFLVLLHDIGDAFVTNEFDENLLMDTLHKFSAR